MNLSPEEREEVATELKRFAIRISNLTDDQKERLRTALTEAREKITEYLHDNPRHRLKPMSSAGLLLNATRFVERVVAFLNPEQLKKWDAEKAQAKDFLGQRLAA